MATRKVNSPLLADTGITFCWVDTMANLKTVAHPAVGAATSKIAVLEGYNSIQDGGGGIFCWDYNATTENNGTIIRPTDVSATLPGRWRRLYSGPVNVKWFGATGLGASDDRAAIQQVIDLVSAQGGGVVYLPAGNYNISQVLIINAEGVSIIGDGKGATFIRKAGIDSTIFDLFTVHYCHIADLALTMQRGTPSQGAAIFFEQGCTSPTIERVYIGSMWQGIIYVAEMFLRLSWYGPLRFVTLIWRIHFTSV